MPQLEAWGGGRKGVTFVPGGGSGSSADGVLNSNWTYRMHHSADDNVFLLDSLRILRYNLRNMRNNKMLDALFPKTRQNILAVLLLSPERRWSLSDLAQRLAVSPSSLQRELASLVEAGILRRETDGSRVYYQTNPDFPLLPELQGIFAKTIGLADHVRKALEPFWESIDLAFIFGSIARGERTARSDVDLLIVGSIGIADLALPLRDLEGALQIPVNVTHYTAAEFRDKRRQKNHFLQTILSGSKIFLKGSEYELAGIDHSAKGQNTFHEQAGAGGSTRRNRTRFGRGRH